jgi:hypothetical protein
MNEQRLPSFWADRLRIATSDSARILARRALATSIHQLAGDKLRARGVPSDVADVEANYLAYELSRRVESGGVRAGFEDAYVRRCAQNRANDHFRETSGLRARCEVRDDDEQLFDERDPERLLEAAREDALLALRIERLRVLIASAPEAYRDVLHEVYVRGVLIEVIVERVLAARVASGEERIADESSRRRARAAVDQRLCRARAWIRARMGVRRA